ncbi:ATP-binding cassette domain-containing protein [Cellulosimicrobium terreum]|nr:ATP-binding cassette domain-containing protein [Cellulosimicrobium terreum]
MIEVQDLTKAYGSTVAVDHASFTVRPGLVTGFLGPNGAGKSTTMRAMLGLDRPTSGRVLVDGKLYRDLRAPLASVGALLDAKALDKGRSARTHLLTVGATIGIGRRRVDEVLEMVGLTTVAGKSATGFSLGMGQRLGLALALLADPETILLDEPSNGLDPEGILWLRELIRSLAAEGRTVFVSSHLMSEMELTADHLVVIGGGRILADVPMMQLLDASSRTHVEVESPDAAELLRVLPGGTGIQATWAAAERLDVTGVRAATIGDVAALHGLRIHSLHTVSASLEEAYMDLTHDTVGYRGTVPASTLLEGIAR